MVLTAVVLLVIDRRLLGERKKGGGAAWVVGHLPTDASTLAWVRCGVEFLPAAILGHPVFVRILALFLFPSFSKLCHASSYSGFRVYLSGLHKCPWFA